MRTLLALATLSLVCSCAAIINETRDPKVNLSVQDEDGMLQAGAKVVLWVDLQVKQPRTVQVDIENHLYNEVTTYLMDAGYKVVARADRDRVVDEIEQQRLYTADPEASRRIVDGLQTDLGFFFDIDGWTTQKSRKNREVTFSGGFKIVDFRNCDTLGSGTVRHNRIWDGPKDVVKIASQSFRHLLEELVTTLRGES